MSSGEESSEASVADAQTEGDDSSSANYSQEEGEASHGFTHAADASTGASELESRSASVQQSEDTIARLKRYLEQVTVYEKSLKKQKKKKRKSKRKKRKRSSLASATDSAVVASEMKSTASSSLVDVSLSADTSSKPPKKRRRRHTDSSAATSDWRDTGTAALSRSLISTAAYPSSAKQTQRKTPKRRFRRAAAASSDWRIECQKLVKHMTSLKSSIAFREPVTDIDAHGYSRIIAEPMCLSLIRQRVDNAVNGTGFDGDRYKHWSEMARDFRLIWRNCLQYNSYQTKNFAIVAFRLCQTFERQYRKKIVGKFESDLLKKALSEAMVDVYASKNSYDFFVPVFWENWKLTDYLEKLNGNEPMDLSTVSNRIDEGVYDSVASFKLDLSLIWENAGRYNAGSLLRIVEIAAKMRDFCEKRIYSKLHGIDRMERHRRESLNSNGFDAMTPDIDTAVGLALEEEGGDVSQVAAELVGADDAVAAENDAADGSGQLTEEEIVSNAMGRDLAAVSAQIRLSEAQVNELNIVFNLLDCDLLDTEELAEVLNRDVFGDSNGDEVDVELDLEAMDDSTRVRFYVFILENFQSQKSEKLDSASEGSLPVPLFH